MLQRYTKNGNYEAERNKKTPHGKPACDETRMAGFCYLRNLPFPITAYLLKISGMASGSSECISTSLRLFTIFSVPCL